MKRTTHRISLITLLTALLLCVTLMFAALPIASEDATTEEESETMEIVVLNQDIPQGGKIKSSYLDTITIKSWNAPKNAICETSKIAGKYARVDMHAGEYVYKELLSDTSVAPSNSHLLIKPITQSSSKTVVVTEFIPANAGEDVTTLLQDLINKNAGRTIYFPDGEYIISRPLKTSAASATSVSLILSDGAVIKADPDKWKSASGGYSAMICMGAEVPQNDVRSQGSYYTLQGGTLDCSGVADGISIDSGRESLIKNIVIKNTPLGVHVKTGANSGSSDIDFEDITIIGNGNPGSKGFYIVGYDNTFTNIKVYDTQIGIQLSSGGNSFRNIQCFYTHSDRISKRMPYPQTIGIYETGQGNFYYHCYVENYSTAYCLNGTMEIFDGCSAKWTANKADGDSSEKHVAFETREAFVSCFANVKVEFYDASANNIVLKDNSGGQGKFESPMITTELCDKALPGAYVRYGIISLPTPTK